ncbi:MAG TPA: hypothetical protein DCS93_41935 [Microscillaceae bacterium]|nr:hypothetical protein [Microscillaceae bacterium]
MKNLIILLLLFIVMACATPSQTKQALQEANLNNTSASSTLTITYIANEGVFLQKKDKKVLIDALHEKYRPIYLYPSTKLRLKMEKGLFPFQGVDLVLVSHLHGDHFGASSCARQLKNNPQTTLIGSKQIRDSLQKTSLFSAIQPQIKVATQTEPITIHDIPVKILKIAHVNKYRYGWVQNFGYIVNLDGQKVLHIGDAEVSKEIFAPFQLPKENIEVAVLPIWFLVSSKGKQLVTQYIRPRHIIASHISVGDEKNATRRIKQYFPQAIVFTQSGQKATF